MRREKEFAETQNSSLVKLVGDIACAENKKMLADAQRIPAWWNRFFFDVACAEKKSSLTPRDFKFGEAGSPVTSHAQRKSIRRRTAFAPGLALGLQFLCG